ncbi:restriction modification system DNA specificity domain [Sutterella sp. CAG:397]|nr:restriction modification system DNA specificity domain [Sutterella sp. CAG:397]
MSNNSIVYSTVRPNQQHFGIITEPPDNLIVSTGFCVIDVDEKIADPRYVYYYLSQSSITKKLHAIAEQATTAYPSIKAKDLGDLEIDLPDLDRQHEVAQILTSLDKKILLNSAINDNLYAVLEAVYQEKFTKPKSESKIGILSDICFYANDKIDVSKLDTRSYFSTENMLPEKKGASNATQLPTVSKVTACSRGDTLISNIRPYFKKIVYSEIKCGCSNDVLCFSPKSQKYSSYLFSTLFDDAFFAFMTAGSKGTKMPRGDKVQIMTYPVKLPADNEVEAFNTVAIPILKQIHSNNMENRELASLRDSLLKTLLSDATK